MLTTRDTTRPTRAWHFLRQDGMLRDGRTPPPDGEWLVHDGEIEICAAGLHASRSPLHALDYAPGPIVCRVECMGDVVEQDDKLVCRERRILWRYDAADVLRAFARRCALDVVHLWEAPPIVVQYLRTGDESLKASAWDAACAAACAAAWDAASAASAARDAAWNARDAAWTARAAAWNARAASAARDAARAAQTNRLSCMLTRGRP